MNHREIKKEIAYMLGYLEDTVISTVNYVREGEYVAVELDRRFIKPSEGRDGKVYEPKFRKDVNEKPRAWNARVSHDGYHFSKRPPGFRKGKHKRHVSS